MSKLKNAQFYIRSMGKLLQVHEIFDAGLDGIVEANSRMERNDSLAVVAETDGYIFLANKHDQGLCIAKGK